MNCATCGASANQRVEVTYTDGARVYCSRRCATVEPPPPPAPPPPARPVVHAVDPAARPPDLAHARAIERIRDHCPHDHVGIDEDRGVCLHCGRPAEAEPASGARP